MKIRFTLVALACLLLSVQFDGLLGQTVVAFQGGEVGDTWTFQPIANAGGPIPPGIVAVNSRTGANAIRVGGGNTACTSGTNCITGGANTASGCAMHGNTLQFDPINVACLPNVQFNIYTRSEGCLGSGFDATDNLNFEVRLDGGAWTNVQNFVGFNEYGWLYPTNPIGPSGNVPNPWTYNVPVNTNTFEFRLRLTVNRSDEVVYVDDVSLTTTSTAYGFPGTAGLWNGAADDNWFNACNWNNRQVPSAATNVTFPTGSNNDIVIQAGQDCQCNNFTCTGAPGRVVKAEANPSKMLTVFGNLAINTTATSAVMDFSDGSIGTPDGTLNLFGNWINNSSAADFVEGESTVNFLGSANQTITLSTIEPAENFFNLSVNKPSGDVVLAKSAQIIGILSLLNGKITTAANAVGVANIFPAAIVGHSTASYVNGNLVRAIQPGPGTRTYDFPLGTAAFYELASLSLTNPSGFSVIAGFFNPLIGGVAPNIVEAGYIYDTILNAGIWTLAPDAAFNGSYDITLRERGYTNGGATRYINVKRPDIAGIWANPGTHVSFSEVGGEVVCTRSGLTAFSDFAIALSNRPLAIDGIGLFAAPTSHGDIALLWDWSDAVVRGKFELVREHEGQRLNLGEWQIGNAMTMETQDLQAPAGLLRYSLYHKDLNGNRSLAASDEVWNSVDGITSPMLWPNPYASDVHLQLGGDTDWQLELMRIDGAQLLKLSGAAVDVQSDFEVAANELTAGVYILKCVHSGKAFHLIMVRQ